MAEAELELAKLGSHPRKDVRGEKMPIGTAAERIDGQWAEVIRGKTDVRARRMEIADGKADVGSETVDVGGETVDVAGETVVVGGGTAVVGGRGRVRGGEKWDVGSRAEDGGTKTTDGGGVGMDVDGRKVPFRDRWMNVEGNAVTLRAKREALKCSRCASLMARGASTGKKCFASVD